MPASARAIVVIVAATLSSALGGCGTINEKITPGVVDSIPQWVGGLPPDVPPRPGTPEYEEFMRERERKRLEPAARDATAKTGIVPASSSTDAVH